MGEHLAELRARFEEELDYEHEAAQERAFAALFARLDLAGTVRIPAVIDDRSSRRVLTTTLAEGLRFEAACAAPEAQRRLWAEALWCFVFGSLLQGGLFNADPHPGNYLFPEGRMAWFLDFGCTRCSRPSASPRSATRTPPPRRTTPTAWSRRRCACSTGRR